MYIDRGLCCRMRTASKVVAIDIVNQFALVANFREASAVVRGTPIYCLSGVFDYLQSN